jgi:hypothetical protein
VRARLAAIQIDTNNEGQQEEVEDLAAEWPKGGESIVGCPVKVFADDSLKH